MKPTVDLNTHLQRILAAKAEAQAKAETEYEEAARALDKQARTAFVRAGYGRDAVVEHIHADAHHGNASDRCVNSRVVNAGCNSRGPWLRIQLGRASGKGYSDSIATLSFDNVQHLITPSHTVFPY